MAVGVRQSVRMDFALPYPIPRWLLRAAGTLRTLFAAPAQPAARDVDSLVVARARRGDHQAFRQIVDHYDNRLRGLAFRLLDDRDRMDDVLQEAYLKAFRSLPKFKGESALGTWLYRVVYNACIDDLRAQKQTVGLDERVDEPDSQLDPAELVASQRGLAAALAALPADQRAAVLLVDAHGLDYAEAAAALGVAAGTIASRLNRARAALRVALEANE